ARKPKDDTARLVFADWLQDRDDPRAPWVREKDVWEWMKPDAKDPTPKLLAGIRKRQTKAALALAKMGPCVVPALLEALNDLKLQQIWNVYYALEQIGPSAEPAVPALLAAIRHKNPQVQIGAYKCLAPLAKTNADSMRAMLGALDDKEGEVRLIALGALHNAGPAAAGPRPQPLPLL